jgi:hypothetical protein
MPDPIPPRAPHVITRDGYASRTLAKGKEKKEKQSFFRKTNPKIRPGAIKNAYRVGFVRGEAQRFRRRPGVRRTLRTADNREVRPSLLAT